jgi:hypothetical protein
VARSPLAAYLPREQWALSYWDEQGMMFTRRSGRSELEYRLLDPTDLDYLRYLKSRGRLDLAALREELLRHQAQAGPSRWDAEFSRLALPLTSN